MTYEERLALLKDVAGLKRLAAVAWNDSRKDWEDLLLRAARALEQVEREAAIYTEVVCSLRAYVQAEQDCDRKRISAALQRSKFALECFDAGVEGDDEAKAAVAREVTL